MKRQDQRRVVGDHERVRRDVDPLGLNGLDLLDLDFDGEVTIEGVRIYGFPWIPTLVDWAFYADEALMKETVKRIPKGIDILVSHGPPIGILDEVRGMNVGCQPLREEVVCRVLPKLHVFGHIHEGFGIHEEFGIKFINAAMADKDYEWDRKPVVVEFP